MSFLAKKHSVTLGSGNKVSDITKSCLDSLPSLAGEGLGLGVNFITYYMTTTVTLSRTRILSHFFGFDRLNTV